MSKKFKLYLIIGIVLVSAAIIVLGKNDKLYKYGSSKEDVSFYSKAFEMNIRTLFENFIDNTNEMDGLLKEILEKGYSTPKDSKDLGNMSIKIRNSFETLLELKSIKLTGKTPKDSRDMNIDYIVATSSAYNVYDVIDKINYSKGNYPPEEYEVNEERKKAIDMLTKAFQEIRDMQMFTDDLAKDNNWIERIDKLTKIFQSLALRRG